MINEFVKFDAVEFLKDSRRWNSREAQLKKELEAISELPGTGISIAKANNISDTVASAAIKREKIVSQLLEIEHYRKALSNALKCLSEAQNEILSVFFFDKGLVSNNVEKYALKHGMCRTHVYEFRRETLEEFSRIITNNYL